MSSSGAKEYQSLLVGRVYDRFGKLIPNQSLTSWGNGKPEDVLQYIEPNKDRVKTTNYRTFGTNDMKRKQFGAGIGINTTLPLPHVELELCANYEFSCKSEDDQNAQVELETEEVCTCRYTIQPDRILAMLLKRKPTIENTARAIKFLDEFGYYYCHSETFGGCRQSYKSSSSNSAASDTSHQAKVGISVAKIGFSVSAGKGQGEGTAAERVYSTQSGRGGDTTKATSSNPEGWQDTVTESSSVHIKYTVKRTMDLFPECSKAYVRLAAAYDEIHKRCILTNREWLNTNIPLLAKKNLNILLVGPKGVGKSSLTNLLYNSAHAGPDYIEICNTGVQRTVTKKLTRVSLWEGINVFDFIGMEISKDKHAKKYYESALAGELKLDKEFGFMAEGKENADFRPSNPADQINCVIVVLDMNIGISDAFKKIAELVVQTEIPVVLCFNQLDRKVGLQTAKSMQLREVETFLSENPNVASDVVKTIQGNKKREIATFALWCPSSPGKDKSTEHWDTKNNKKKFKLTVIGVCALRMLYTLATGEKLCPPQPVTQPRHTAAP